LSESTKPIQVTFDPSFIQESLSLWRQATDMQIPMHDEFKLHFMQNRRKILANHANTARSWSMMLRALTPSTPSEQTDLDSIRMQVEEFGSWANDQIAEMEHLAVQESLSASMDEALLSPEFRRMFKDFGSAPPDDKG
jgi:hypothetical protein